MHIAVVGKTADKEAEKTNKTQKVADKEAKEKRKWDRLLKPL